MGTVGRGVKMHRRKRVSGPIALGALLMAMNFQGAQASARETAAPAVEITDESVTISVDAPVGLNAALFLEESEEDAAEQTPSAPTCYGAPATIVGTSGADTITGTPLPDVIQGLGGDDTINGMDGSDLVCGGNGADTLNGNNGSDKVRGGPGNDINITGGPGDDSNVDGRSGDDTVKGGIGSDTVVGGTGKDSLYDQWGTDAVYALDDQADTINWCTDGDKGDRATIDGGLDSQNWSGANC